jgi:Ser/Thr protein kinase RdoA (MazF antagonist)
MMKLGLMKQFFDSVDGEWRSPLADAIARQWFSGDFGAYCLRASANFAFIVKAEGRNYLLRFNHESERQAAFIAAELAFIAHLAARGVRVARPLPSLAGRLMESVPTPFGLCHGALFEFLPGEQLELEALDPEKIRRWGRALGEMHRAGEGLKIGGRPDWSAQLDWLRQVVPRRETLVWREADAVAERLQALPRSDANFGLIHYDFEPDNLVWSGAEIGIFDLDDCAYSWFAMDIVNALGSELFDDCIGRFDFTNPRLQGFLEGYRSARPIDDAELQWAPLFLRLDNLIAFARVYRSIAAGPVADEPQWTTDLRQKLQRMLDKYREAFQNYPIATQAPGAGRPASA